MGLMSPLAAECSIRAGLSAREDGMNSEGGEEEREEDGRGVE